MREMTDWSREIIILSVNQSVNQSINQSTGDEKQTEGEEMKMSEAEEETKKLVGAEAVDIEVSNVRMSK